jgi:hypothetical protein
MSESPAAISSYYHRWTYGRLAATQICPVKSKVPLNKHCIDSGPRSASARTSVGSFLPNPSDTLVSEAPPIDIIRFLAAAPPADLLHPLILDEGGSDLSIGAGDDVENAGERLCQQGECASGWGEGRRGRRFDHDGVAGKQRVPKARGWDPQWPVVWDIDRHHTQGQIANLATKGRGGQVSHTLDVVGKSRS